MKRRTFLAGLVGLAAVATVPQLAVPQLVVPPPPAIEPVRRYWPGWRAAGGPSEFLIRNLADQVVGFNLYGTARVTLPSETHEYSGSFTIEEGAIEKMYARIAAEQRKREAWVRGIEKALATYPLGPPHLVFDPMAISSEPPPARVGERQWRR